MAMKKTPIRLLCILFSVAFLLVSCQQSWGKNREEISVGTAAGETQRVDSIRTSAYHTVMAGQTQTKNAALQASTSAAESTPTPGLIYPGQNQNILGTDTLTPVLTQTPTNTLTQMSTITPTATNTVTLTPTITLTWTASPSPTNTPLPKSLKFDGKGNTVQTIRKWSGPAVVHIRNTEKKNFIVWTQDADGNDIDMLVNSIGDYEGALPIDILFNKQTAGLKITSDGNWTIEISPITEDYIHTITIPGTYIGKGDDVVLLAGNPIFAQFTVPGSGIFIVWTYTMSSGVMLLNEKGPYYGYLDLIRDHKIIAIKSESEWTMQVK